MGEHIQVYNPVGGQPYGTAPTPKTSSGSIDVSDSSNKISTTEWVKSSIAGKNVGDEWHSFTGQIPAGGVPYCGQEVTRATYADLWNYVQEQGLVKTESEWQSLNTSQNGNVPFYSDGDGSTTFRMPKVVGYIKGASSLDGVGVYTAEGLPNITGGTNSIEYNGTYESISLNGNAFGAFNKSKRWSETGGIYTCALQSVNDNTGLIPFFDASLSNYIYGNSSHVTPETITVLFGVYAYGEMTVTGSTTTDALAIGLATVESKIIEKEYVIEKGSNYIRYDSGLQMCFGISSEQNSIINITFSLAFASIPSVNTSVYGFGTGSYVYETRPDNVTTTGFKAYSWAVSNGGSITGNPSSFSWIAIGFWK